MVEEGDLRRRQGRRLQRCRGGGGASGKNGAASALKKVECAREFVEAARSSYVVSASSSK